MVYTVSITSQGQISIPAKARKKVGFTKRAILSVEKDHLVLKPVADVMDLMGSLKTNKKPLSGEKIHKLFAEAMARGEV
ncbi:MAG TPA: AbrB/MazE/SpoVT family DNA-binding domain-containing protein [Patescibacteria group bacterium]